MKRLRKRRKNEKGAVVVELLAVFGALVMLGYFIGAWQSDLSQRDAEYNSRNIAEIRNHVPDSEAADLEAEHLEFNNWEQVRCEADPPSDTEGSVLVSVEVACHTTNSESRHTTTALRLGAFQLRCPVNNDNC